MSLKNDRITQQSAEIARLKGENEFLRSHTAALHAAIEADEEPAVAAPPAPPAAPPAPPPGPVPVAPAPAAEPVFPSTKRGRLAEYLHAYAQGMRKIRAGRP